MSEILDRVRRLVARGECLISRHGFRELSADDILVADAIGGVELALLVEEYPDSRKEPSVLVLQQDHDGRPIHVMWGIPRSTGTPAVLVTAYRPKPELWSDDFLNRKKR